MSERTNIITVEMPRGYKLVASNKTKGAFDIVKIDDATPALPEEQLIEHLKKENARVAQDNLNLRAEIERLKEHNQRLNEMHEVLAQRIAFARLHLNGDGT